MAKIKHVECNRLTDAIPHNVHRDIIDNHTERKNSNFAVFESMYHTKTVWEVLWRKKHASVMWW